MTTPLDPSIVSTPLGTQEVLPIEMASETVMVLKMTALPPAPFTPSAACLARPSMCTLHGVTWLHVEQMPTCDFAKSSRVKPTACNMARPCYPSSHD